MAYLSFSHKVLHMTRVTAKEGQYKVMCNISIRATYQMAGAGTAGEALK